MWIMKESWRAKQQQEQRTEHKGQGGVFQYIILIYIYIILHLSKMVFFMQTISPILNH